MNEEAIKDAYGLFVGTGYKGSLEDFNKLMKTNAEARKDAFGLFTETGYNGKQSQFDSLMGLESSTDLKKKSPSESILETETTVSPSELGVAGLVKSTKPVVEADLSKLTKQTIEEPVNKVADAHKKSELNVAFTSLFGEIESNLKTLKEQQSNPNAINKLHTLQITPEEQRQFSPIDPRGIQLKREAEFKEKLRNAKSAEEVRDITFAINAEKVNNAYRSAYNIEAVSIDDEINKDLNIINFDADGRSTINEKNLSKSLVDIKRVQIEEQKRILDEAVKISPTAAGGHLLYDITTGVMDLTNSIQGIFDREGAQEDMYENQARTQASYMVHGLSNEEVSKGIVENFKDGNFSAASKIFSVQAAQTTPQLLAQVAVAYGTGGLGLGTSGALWASSAFMGASSFGRTWAETNGLMDDSKAFTLALGDAAVEVVSERIFSGDVKALAGLDNLKGMSIAEIRRNVFGKGLISSEIRNLAKAKGVEILKGGGEEFVEELFAGIGSGLIHSAVNGEEFNVYEILDGGVIGFGMGAGAKGTANIRPMLTAGVSALGFGGLRSEMITYKNARQALSKELSETTDSVKKTQLESKIRGLDKTITSIGVEMAKTYEQYSDEDAQQTLTLNQKISNKLSELSGKQTSPAVRKALKMEVMALFGEVKTIESKYQTIKETIQNERRDVVIHLDKQEQSSIEVDDNFDTGGIKMFEGIKNVANALRGKSKVFIHKSAKDAAEVMGRDVAEIHGAGGIFQQDDGSIHIIPPLAQNNTGYHEAMHKVARTVDVKFIDRFVEASILGMDDATSEKYREIQVQYKDNKRLSNEEVFAEIIADITDGTISMENQGTSVARAGMKVVSDLLGSIGVKVPMVATLKDFTEFVGNVSKDLKSGTEVIEAPDRIRTAENTIESDDLLQQSSALSEKSPEDFYGAFDPSSSEVYAKMVEDKDGNFVFTHVSHNKFTVLDPEKFGSNPSRKTSRGEISAIGAANVGGVSMLYVDNETDVPYTYMYEVVIPPHKVYNGVNDPLNLSATAQDILTDRGVDFSPNAVYALVTKMANDRGFDVAVVPWNGITYKAQTTKKLKVKHTKTLGQHNSFKNVADSAKLEHPNSKTWKSVDSIHESEIIEDAIEKFIEAIPMSDVDAKHEMLVVEMQNSGFMRMNSNSSTFATKEDMVEFVKNSEVMKKYPRIAKKFVSEVLNAEHKNGYSIRISRKINQTVDNVIEQFNEKSDGFSFDPMTGEGVSSGFAVGDNKNEIQIKKGESVSAKAVRTVVEAALKNPLGIVGGWADSTTGTFYLDVSEVHEKMETGIEYGLKRDEVAIFDINTFTEINLKHPEKNTEETNKVIEKVRGRLLFSKKPKTKSIDDLMGDEPYSEGADVVEKGGELVVVQPRTKHPYANMSNIINLRMISLREFMNNVGGLVYAITSDATKVGIDKNNNKIDGGFGYTGFLTNLKNKIGFASIGPNEVASTMGALLKRFPVGTTVGIMIMVQNPYATLGNFYGALYLHRALMAAIKAGNFDEVYNGMLDVIKTNKNVREGLVKEGNKRALIKLLSEVSNFSEKAFADEFIKDTSFEVRRELMKATLIPSATSKIKETTAKHKEVLAGLGFNITDFLMEFGDIDLIGENNLRNDEGGFIVGGFETVVLSEAEIKEFIKGMGKKGFTHPQFNGKIPSNGNHFIFDGLYPIQENFVDYAKLDTEIPEELKGERDIRVREMKESSFFAEITDKNSSKYVEPSKRTYSNLKTYYKIKFKKQNADLVQDAIPNLHANVAKGLGFTFKPDVFKIPDELQFTKALLHQMGIFKEIAEMLSDGKNRAEIMAELKSRGIGKVEAELIYKKALGYKLGNVQGRVAGRRERSAEYAVKMAAEREKESKDSKALRLRAAKIYKIEGRVNKEFIREFVKLVKEIGGSKIKANQLEKIIRIVNSAARIRGRRATYSPMRLAAFNSILDRITKVIDGIITSKELTEHIDRLDRVMVAQRRLKGKLKSVSATSKSPLISYSESILELTSIDPTLISTESLKALESALTDLDNTAKVVTVKQGIISSPYEFIDVLGVHIDTRRAKIYFSEIFDIMQHESMEMQERQLLDMAMTAAKENGTNWALEYDKILKGRLKKELKGAEARMHEIAASLGLDMNDIQELETVLEKMDEEDKQKIEEVRSTIIHDAIIPTFLNFMREFMNDEHFAAIFGVSEYMSDDAIISTVESRMYKLKGYELKRLEFAMFDYAVNGKAYGIMHLAAIITAKNDGVRELQAVNIIADKHKAKTSNHVFNLFENTQTFFRRTFKQYSVSKIAKFIDAIGYASLRKNVAIADAVSNEFNKRMIEKAKELKINSLHQQVQMQLYSILTQIPEGQSKTVWLRGVMGNIELAIESDNRFTDAQKDEIRDAVGVFKGLDGRTRNYDVIVNELEQNKEIVEMVKFLRDEFAAQESGLRDYAEGFLGMKFETLRNYLPYRFRSTGSMTRNLQELADSNKTISQAFKAFNVANAGKQADSTYERNEKAFESIDRYIDLNFLSTLNKAYRENQVKSTTASDVAFVSAMTSESNDAFIKSVPDVQARVAMRRKIYNYLTDGGEFTSSTNAILGAKLANVIGRIKDVTVLYYFGSVVIQLFKQSTAIANAMVEGHSSPIELLINVGQVLTNTLDEGKKKLMDKYDIGQRDIVQDVITATSKADAVTKGGGFFEKNMDRSTFFLRRTDKAAAMASWLSYYESYLRKNGGVVGPIDWDKASEESSNTAAEYASMMVVKDQNINTSRDKSYFNSLNQSQLTAIVQMLVMPFANFLLNKKLNMALDYQKLVSNDAENKKEGAKSLAGSLLEISAFHAVSQFVIIPLLHTVATGIWGSDDEDESLFDKQFKMRTFLKGVSSDMNPLVVPIGAMEAFYAKSINLLAYVASGDVGKYSMSDKGFWDGFDAWSSVNGLPTFGGAGRDDLGALSFLRQFGVFGDVAVEATTSMMNLLTLNEKNPYMTSVHGSVKYLTPEDASNALKLEFLKVSLLMTGALTGLFAKESVSMIKSKQKEITARGISSEKENIGRILLEDTKLGTELVSDMVYSLQKDNPLAIESAIRQITNVGTVNASIDNMVDDRFVNTIRQIEKMSYDDIRYAGLYAKKIMDGMSPRDAKRFETDLLSYMYVKHGGGSLVRMKVIIENKEK